jgi:hypothetical protein
MKSKLPSIIFAITLIIAITAVAFAILYRRAEGVFLYDTNFETFHDTLTPFQRGGIVRSLHAISSLYLMLLIVTNAIWIGAGYCLLSHIKKQEQPGA